MTSPKPKLHRDPNDFSNKPYVRDSITRQYPDRPRRRDGYAYHTPREDVPEGVELPPNYFHLARADTGDILLLSLKFKGLVPFTCLQGGVTASELINDGKDPCAYCAGPRDVCKGRPKST